MTVAAITALATSLAVTTFEVTALLDVEVRCSSPVPAAPGTYPAGNADDDEAADTAGSVSMILLAAALALSLSEVALSFMMSYQIISIAEKEGELVR